VIGIPKTIDNDLAITDHTPGYPSAARFFIHAARDIGLDNRALPTPVCILETLGRNTGWITAATALARADADDAPHLIYFPERRVSLDRMAADVEGVYRRIGRVVIAVCEGQLDETGQPFGADVDRPESAVHRLSSNLGHTLANALARKTGLRARAEKPEL
jgi:6-phosphofructokinase